jgi:hypothetical protein
MQTISNARDQSLPTDPFKCVNYLNLMKEADSVTDMFLYFKYTVQDSQGHTLYIYIYRYTVTGLG